MIFEPTIPGLDYVPEDESDFYTQNDKFCELCGSRFPEDTVLHDTSEGELCDSCFKEFEEDSEEF